MLRINMRLLTAEEILLPEFGVYMKIIQLIALTLVFSINAKSDCPTSNCTVLGTPSPLFTVDTASGQFAKGATPTAGQLLGAWAEVGYVTLSPPPPVNIEDHTYDGFNLSGLKKPHDSTPTLRFSQLPSYDGNINLGLTYLNNGQKNENPEPSSLSFQRTGLYFAEAAYELDLRLQNDSYVFQCRLITEQKNTLVCASSPIHLSTRILSDASNKDLSWATAKPEVYFAFKKQ